MKNRYFTCLGILFSVLCLTASTVRAGHGVGEVTPTSVEVERCDDQISVDAWAPVTCDSIACGSVEGSAVVDKVVGEESPTSISVVLTGSCSHGDEYNISADIPVIYPAGACNGVECNLNRGGGGPPDGSGKNRGKIGDRPLNKACGVGIWCGKLCIK